MKAKWILLLSILAVPVSVAPADAQEFQGRGQDASRPFPLAAGLAVFESRYNGEGRFHVQLLDESGNLIGAVADATGVFGGAKAIQIPRTGLYVIDVQAQGEWSVKLRSNEAGANGLGPGPEHLAGAEAGALAAREPGTGGTFALGFLGGVLTGPIGTLIVANRAGASAESAGRRVADTLPVDHPPGWVAGYRQSYTEQLRSRRTRAAFIGGIIGTGVFAFALIQLLDIGGTSEGGDPGEPGNPAIVVPIFRF